MDKSAILSDERLLHDVAKLVSSTNTNIGRMMLMLRVFAPNTEHHVNDDDDPIDLLNALAQSLEMFLQAENDGLRSTPSYGALAKEYKKLCKLQERFGSKGPHRSIEICVALDVQIKILAAQGVGLRKQLVRDLKRDYFNLWQAGVRSELSRLKDFGAALKDQLDTLSHADYDPAPSWLKNWSDSDDLKTIFERIAAEHDGWASAHGVDLRIIANELVDITYLVDAEGIALAFQHLLQNAIKYTGQLAHLSEHKAPWVVCTGELVGNDIVVSVESWGTPLTPEEQDPDLLCSDGYRGYFAKRSEVEGTGRGLAQVRTIMNNNDGMLEIDTKPVAKGTKVTRPAKSTFSLRFPAGTSNG